MIGDFFAQSRSVALPSASSSAEVDVTPYRSKYLTINNVLFYPGFQYFLYVHYVALCLDCSLLRMKESWHTNPRQMRICVIMVKLSETRLVNVAVYLPASTYPRL